MHTSDGSSLPCGNLSDLLNRSPLPVYLRTNEAKDAWFAVDLGLWLEPTHYTLRHGRGSGPLRSWLFQASRDGTIWSILRSHVEDTTLNAPGSTATWRLDQSADGKAWRYFRVSITAEMRNRKAVFALVDLRFTARSSGCAMKSVSFCSLLIVGLFLSQISKKRSTFELTITEKFMSLLNLPSHFGKWRMWIFS